jgi:superfamily II DNA or RNA helicase
MLTPDEKKALRSLLLPPTTTGGVNNKAEPEPTAVEGGGGAAAGKHKENDDLTDEAFVGALGRMLETIKANEEGQPKEGSSEGPQEPPSAQEAGAEESGKRKAGPTTTGGEENKAEPTAVEGGGSGATGQHKESDDLTDELFVGILDRMMEKIKANEEGQPKKGSNETPPSAQEAEAEESGKRKARGPKRADVKTEGSPPPPGRADKKAKEEEGPQGQPKKGSNETPPSAQEAGAEESGKRKARGPKRADVKTEGSPPGKADKKAKEPEDDPGREEEGRGGAESDDGGVFADALGLEPPAVVTAGAAEAFENREYQTEAIKACLRELGKPPRRAILQMACRCGKTRVAHGVIRDYLETPRRSSTRPRVLYLVPGLVLLRQTVQKLDNYGLEGVEVLIVGSDDRPITGLRCLTPGDGQETAAGSTDPRPIQKACTKEEGGGLLVISTYQSSTLLPDVFDLIVFDESHRTCGENQVRPFTHVLLTHKEGDRLYMTATPRYDAAVSMKDRDLYGGVAYAYHMRQGIDAGYVNAFNVELVGRAANGDPPGEATAAQVIAALEAIIAAGGGKLLVFCQNINHAARLQRGVAAALAARGKAAVETMVAHSGMAQADVAERLTAFSAPGVPAVLFNCRLFQEGVEIPALNGVFFAAPRNSPRDIIQSLCRPLNVQPGKPPSKVFIPVALDTNESVDSIANLERFASIIPYFDALIAEDPLLYEHLLNPQGVPYPLRWVDSALGGCRYEVDRMLAAARRSVRHGGSGRSERLLRAGRIPWEIGFAELQRIVTDCRRYPKTTDCFVYGDAHVNFGLFYRHVREAYAKWKAGQPQPLEPYQLHALEELRGWVPYGVEGPYPWQESLAFLENWLQNNQGVPPMVDINKGGFVGLDATPMERLSGTLTCVNQGDGRDHRGSRPGSGLKLEASKQRDLDALCSRWNLRWRKDRLAAPDGSPGSLVVNSKGEYNGSKTFIQEAYARFKKEWEVNKRSSTYILHWFPGYPSKHNRQEHSDVWANRHRVVPPRWRRRRGELLPTSRPRLPAAPRRRGPPRPLENGPAGGAAGPRATRAPRNEARLN